MASAVLHPDAALFPPGTTVDVREKALLAPVGSLAPGSALSSPTVAADGSLTVTGLTEGKRYEARATVGGSLHQLEFAPEIAPPSSGLTQAEVETLISEKAVSTASPAFTGTPTAPTAAEGDNSTKLATTKYADRAVSTEATTRASADTTEKSARETLAGEAVKLTGTQTVAGVKTFSSSPVVPAPTTALQAATKAYVDAAIEGLNAHPNVRVATAAALPANAYLAGVITGSGVGALTVDGIAVAAGNRVLVKNEVAKANNGLYVVTAPGAVAEAFVLTRAADMNENAEVPGAFVFAEQGTVNSNNGFFVASPGPFTIGTTAIEWSQFTGAGDLVAGSGITLTGNEVSAAKAREEAEAASQKRQAVHASITTEVTASADELSPVDATAGALKIKLPTGLGAGRLVWVEKSDSSANTVTVEGNMRGVAAQSIALKSSKQTLAFMTDSAGSWWPIADHITNSAMKSETRTIARRTISIGAGQAPGNEVILDEYVKLVSGEVRKILWVECHTTSGTITVKIGRGEAGTTEIAAYNAIAVTSSIQLIETTQALSDKDRLRITLSAGSTPKGLSITIGEEVVAP